MVKDTPLANRILDPSGETPPTDSGFNETTQGLKASIRGRLGTENTTCDCLAVRANWRSDVSFRHTSIRNSARRLARGLRPGRDDGALWRRLPGAAAGPSQMDIVGALDHAVRAARGSLLHRAVRASR